MTDLKKKSPRFYGGVFGFFIGILTTVAVFWMIYDSHNSALDEYEARGGSPGTEIDPFPFRVFESMVSGEQIVPMAEKDRIVYIRTYVDKDEQK